MTNKKVSCHILLTFSTILQVNAGEILTEMAKSTPADAFCVSGITMCDLYPRDDWNFVFGLARLGDGVGVYSLARYTPGFFEAGHSTKMNDLNRYGQPSAIKIKEGWNSRLILLLMLYIHNVLKGVRCHIKTILLKNYLQM